jgi:hypothetical protein
MHLYNVKFCLSLDRSIGYCRRLFSLVNAHCYVICWHRFTNVSLRYTLRCCGLHWTHQPSLTAQRCQQCECIVSYWLRHNIPHYTPHQQTIENRRALCELKARFYCTDFWIYGAVPTLFATHSHYTAVMWCALYCAGFRGVLCNRTDCSYIGQLSWLIGRVK